MDNAHHSVATIAEDAAPDVSILRSWGHGLRRRLNLRLWSHKSETNSCRAVDHSSMIDSCCSSCSHLNISRQNFLLGEDTNYPSKVVDSSHTTLGAVNLGFLEDIYARRASCAFCRLVHKATNLDNIIFKKPQENVFNNEDGRTICWMEWQIYGRTQSEAVQPANTLLHFTNHWQSALLVGFAYIVKMNLSLTPTLFYFQIAALRTARQVSLAGWSIQSKGVQQR